MIFLSIEARLRQVIVACCATVSVPVAAHGAVVISSAKTKSITCNAGVCTPKRNNAVLNVNDLGGMIAVGDVTIKADRAKDIVITVPLSWTSNSRLTLAAPRTVWVGAGVSVVGQGAVSVTTNDGGAGGDLLFADGSSLTFWDMKSALFINGKKYKLGNSISELASEIAGNPNGFYALANDYDSTTKYQSSPIFHLEGTFEGLGHVVSGLSIDTSGNYSYGLIGSGTQGTTVRDVHLTKVNIVSHSRSSVGALLGGTTGEVSILNSSAQGSVTAGTQSIAGGLVGGMDGVVVNSSAAVDVRIDGDNPGYADAGGLVGAGGTIVLSHATGNVSGGKNTCAGGLAGNDASIEASYATGAVTTGDNTNYNTQYPIFAGGLACVGTADQSFATGSVTGGDHNVLGGLIGYGAYLSDCYALGDVVAASPGSLVGGLLGYGDHVTTSYSIGRVHSRVGIVGGFVGHDDVPGSISQSYWDIETSHKKKPAGLPKNDFGMTGLTTAQLQGRLPPGFKGAVWAQDKNINNGFPYLRATPPQ